MPDVNLRITADADARELIAFNDLLEEFQRRLADAAAAQHFVGAMEAAAKAVDRMAQRTVQAQAALVGAVEGESALARAAELAWERMADIQDREMSRADAARVRELEKRLADEKRADEQLVQARQAYANAVMAADERLAQRTAAADETMVQRVAAATARVVAVTERSEAVRLQVGARGAQQRLQRLVETENQMDHVQANAEAARNRTVQEAEVQRLRTIMEAAQEQANIISKNEQASRQLRTAAQQEALRATDAYYTSLNQTTAQREAQNTAIVQAAARARAHLSEQIGAERIMTAAGGGGAGGGGGGLTGLLGGFGGFGGAGGIGGFILNAARGGLGAIGSMLSGAAGAAFSGLQTLGQGALNALMLPVQAVSGLFNRMTDAIGGASNSLQQFVTIGLGLYGMWEIVNRTRMVIEQMAGAIVNVQDVMTKVGSLTGATMQDMQEMTAQVLQVSMETGRPAQELGEAMYFIQSHSIEGAAALRTLENAAKLAAAGLGETNQIVRVVSGQMLAYNEVLDGSAKSMEIVDHYFDVFARTVQISAVPADEIAKTFARITPLAAALHIPITELGADFATISQTGLNANRVMTDLIAVFNQFLQGSKKQVEALQSIGLSIDQVRKTLSERGLIAAAMEIWQAADRDIAKVSEIFGDRTRALTGFLALVEDGGARATENLDKMAAAGGRMDEVYTAALGRISVQWNRFMRIIEAVGVVIVNFSTHALGTVTEDMDRVNDAMQRADFSGAAAAIGKLFTDIKDGALAAMNYLAEQMFGSGVSIVSALANGIMSAANTILNSVVNAVADLIAGVLLGHSWPPRGPLSNGDAGTRRWMEAKARAMEANTNIVEQAAAHVAEAVNRQVNEIGNVKGTGFSEAFVKQKIADLDAQLLPWKNAAQDIKDHYEDMLRPLDRQIEALRHIKDLEYERQQLQFRQRDIELDMLRLRAEGDPARRAQIAGQIARQQEINEQHDIQRSLAALARREREMGRQRMTPQERALERQQIADERAMLLLRQQEHRLRNPQLLGQYAQQKALLDLQKQSADIDHRKFELNRDITLQPLIEQHDQIVARQKEELDQINDHVRVLEQERRKWQEIERQIQAAKAAARGAGGGAGSWIQEAYEREGGLFGGAVKQIRGVAEAMAQRFREGFEGFMRDNGGAIGQSVIGFIAGGMIGGIPGAFSGAVLVPKIMQALEDRDVTVDDWQAFVNRAQASFMGAWNKVQTKLTAGDVLGAVDAFMDSVRVWVSDLETAMFREWETSRIPGIPGKISADIQSTLQDYSQAGAGAQQFAEANIGSIGTRRYTGLGRTIIEALFGRQDKELTFRTAYDMINERILQPAWQALSTAISDFFNKPTMQEEYVGGPQVAGPPQAAILGDRILNALKTAFDWIGKNFGPLSESLGTTLANAFSGAVTFLDQNPKMKEVLGSAFENLGGRVAGRFARGLFGNPWQAGTTGEGQMPGEQAGRSYRAGISAAIADPGKAASAVLAGGEAALMNSPFAAPAMLLFGAFTWIKDNLPATLEAIGDIITTKVRDFRTNILEPYLNWVKMAWSAAWDFVSTQVENNLITIDHALSLAFRSIKAAFTDIFGDAPAGVKTMITVFGSVFETQVQSWSADSLWQPLFNKIDTLKARLTDRELARLLRQVADVPAPTGTSGTGGGSDRNVMGATGADFIVGGTGGTDSQHVSMWLTPGERVRVTPGDEGDGRAVINKAGDININAPLIQADKIDNDTDLDGMLDRVRAFLVEDIRAARGQGVQRPQGITPRGSR